MQNGTKARAELNFVQGNHYNDKLGIIKKLIFSWQRETLFLNAFTFLAHCFRLIIKRREKRRKKYILTHNETTAFNETVDFEIGEERGRERVKPYLNLPHLHTTKNHEWLLIKLAFSMENDQHERCLPGLHILYLPVKTYISFIFIIIIQLTECFN